MMLPWKLSFLPLSVLFHSFECAKILIVPTPQNIVTMMLPWKLSFLPLSVLFHSFECAKILIVPTPQISHVFPLLRIGEAVISTYNHSVALLGDKYIIKSPLLHGLKVSIIESRKLSAQDFPAKAKELSVKEVSGSATVFDVIEQYTNMCTTVLGDEELMEKLKKENFDLLITMAGVLGDCLNYIGYKLSIPIVHAGPFYDASYYRIPINPCVTPEYPMTTYGEAMTFGQRLQNTIIMYLKILLSESMERSDLSAKYVPEKPVISVKDLRRHVQFALLDFDVLIDYPRPAMPNIAFVGGLNTSPAQKLNADFQSLMDSATDGIIVVSFGSFFESFPQEKLKKIFNAMKGTSLKFIMKYGSEPDRDGNIFLRPWLPQNDLLAHRNTRAFITHCGNSGQYDSLLHGVPMIGIPLFGDQFYNAERMVHKGFGLSLSLTSLETDSLTAVIKEVVENPSYKQKIRKASEVFRSRLPPSERAAFWVDHVIKYGGTYMQSHGMSLPWYTYLGADVCLFFFTVIVLMCVTLVFVCRALRRLCMRNTKPKQS